MPSGLHRTYGAHHLHFITCSCYRRLPFLKGAHSGDRLLAILEQVRQRYRFVVVGFVVMPEHIHLLITEPEMENPSTILQVLKQPTARALLPKPPPQAVKSSESARQAATKIALTRGSHPSPRTRRMGYPHLKWHDCPTQAKSGLEWATRPSPSSEHTPARLEAALKNQQVHGG